MLQRIVKLFQHNNKHIEYIVANSKTCLLISVPQTSTHNSFVMTAKREKWLNVRLDHIGNVHKESGVVNLSTYLAKNYKTSFLYTTK